MGRWQPDAQGRLAQAALELYSEKGFEQTTVAEIAQRAGLTERTFFRHFADKREVLFARSEDLVELVSRAVAEAPTGMTPFDAATEGIGAVGTVLQGGRAHSRRRQSVIDANRELQERELSKMATLGAAITEALHERGVDEPAASLAAESAIAVFKIAFARWLREEDRDDLAGLVRESRDQLKAVAAGT